MSSEAAMRLLLVVMAQLALAPAKAAGPITVKGLNIEMSRATVERVLEEEGYACRHEGNGGGYVLTCTTGSPTDTVEIRFATTEIVHLITVSHIESIVFSCGSLSLCEKSLDERRRALIAARCVDALEPGCGGACLIALGGAGDRLVVGEAVQLERR
jgi:hypothetical protein